MSYEQITLVVEGQIATVTLNRPEKLNTWTPIMGAELMDAFRRIDADASVRVALFTGAGDRAFCAGADMGFFAEQIKEGGGTSGRGGPSRIADFPLLMRQLSKPTIAVVNGYALGVGATMPLLCDMRIAAAEAEIGFLFGRMGVMAELGSTYLLPRLVGTARACELMFTGKRFAAADCERMGLVNRVVPRAELTAAAHQLALEITQCAPLSIMLTRQALYQGLEGTFASTLQFEAYALDYLYRSNDHAEAVAAFREKRAPTFRGA
jgi:enoyl-CoA hydratase/carnithine racemase